jgi:hypothetical protein
MKMAYRNNLGYYYFEESYGTPQTFPTERSEEEGSNILPFLASLIGVDPRGNLQKFHRTAYPYMAKVAKESGIPVYIGWFGEMVVVNPDGTFGTAIFNPGNVKSIAQMESEVMTLQAGMPWYDTDATGDPVNNPASLFFILIDYNGVAPGLQDVVQNVTPTTGNTISLPPVTTTPTGGTSPTGQYSAMGIDLKSLMLWGGLAGLAYMLITERKKRG